MNREHASIRSAGGGKIRGRRAVLPTLLVALRLALPHAATAAGVVGTGTPESCTEAALDAALAGGGLVRFNCGVEPVPITLTS